MQLKSILLAVSPSAKSRFASTLCQNISKASGAKIAALHVVDTDGAWEFLGYDEPGFMGSGMQMAAYETLVSSMQNLGRKLGEVYEAHAGENQANSEYEMCEGAPVDQLLKRSADHDLVIVGHKRSCLERKVSSRQFSVAESLAQSITRPLLIVQDRCDYWKKLRIVVPIERAGTSFVNDCLDFAYACGLEPEILGLVTGDAGEGRKDPAVILRVANPRFEKLKLNVYHIPRDVINEGSWGWWAAQEAVETDEASHTLEVIPTRVCNKHKVTVFGSPAGFFVRHVGASAILLWPELAQDVPDEAECDRLAANFVI